MAVFEKLLLWIDPVKRSGPEAMAVDEWLLATSVRPVLRVYGWAGEWASVGYFGKMGEARKLFPRVSLVRRWTGGGIVDHRADWTYTVVAPRGESLANWRGAESYREIHTALSESLAVEGISARLSEGDNETGAELCFENPVSHDLLGSNSRKLAGAGQRRGRDGLLHQGSVALAWADEAASRKRAEHLASQMSGAWEHVSPLPSPQEITRRIAARYGNEAWTNRR